MHAHPATRDRLAVLDGLRFLAALMVVLFHLVATATWQPWWGRPSGAAGEAAFTAASYGWAGVSLFFMISGFVICMSSWGRTPAQFGVSRFVRLYPAYWVAIGLTTTVRAVYAGASQPLPWREVLLNLTMFHEPLGVPSVDGVYWTLWVELRFYLIFALLIWRGLTYQRVVAFCVAWAVVSAWAPQLDQPWLRHLLIYDQAHYFIAGIALFLIYRFGPHPVLWLLLGFSWLMSVHYYADLPWQGLNNQSYLPSTILITSFYLLLALVALHRLDWLRWRGLTVLGATTYPLYLMHDVIGVAALRYFHDELILPRWALTAIVIVALTVLAWLVHRLVERPLAPVLKRWLGRAVTKPVPESPAPAPALEAPAPEQRAARHSIEARPAAQPSE